MRAHTYLAGVDALGDGANLANQRIAKHCMARQTTSCATQIRALQTAVAVLAFVPIGAGLAGAVFGIGVFESTALLGQDAESTGRYLSGLLLAIGLAFWATVPRIQAQGVRFRLLTLLVFTGGLARLAGLLLVGIPSPVMLGGLAMELLVTPGLALWRERLERLCNGGATPA